MSKQVYIDENGNEIQVSGTVNTADMMPMSGNDSTKVSEAIGSLSTLTTTDKSSLVGAVNEVKGSELKVATFTASVTTTTSGGQQVGEITVANMTGYDATIWGKMKAYSIFGSYANDGRFGIIPVIRSSNTILSFIALAGGTYSVTMFVFYSDT